MSVAASPATNSELTSAPIPSWKAVQRKTSGASSCMAAGFRGG